LVAIFGAGAGMGGLQYAGRYGIRSYNQLAKVLRGTGLQAHHMIRKRFAPTLGLDKGEMACIAVTRSTSSFIPRKNRGRK